MQKLRPVDLSEYDAKLLREGSAKGGKLASPAAGTLDKYGHLFDNTDAMAAQVMEQALGQTLTD